MYCTFLFTALYIQTLKQVQALTAENRAHVDITFFTQNDSYNQ